jgi:hypothetical protein
MDFRGKVVRKPFGVGSKSERDAVVLVTEDGEYVLRRQGGNPFRDPELDALVGRSIQCQGFVYGYTLIVSSWSEAEP